MPDALPIAAAEPTVDLKRPSIARMYDYLVGGTANWAIDRLFASDVLRTFPEFKRIVRANRMFANRVVRHLAKLGVRQFIDIGSGIYSRGNTHQVADENAGDCRVVYVDNGAVTVAHAEVLLDEVGDPDRHAIVNADLRCPDALWKQLDRTGIVDLAEPVAVLMFSVLHMLRPEPGGNDPVARLVAEYRRLLPTGSYLGISHVTQEGIPDELAPKLTDLGRRCRDECHEPVYGRTHGEIRSLFAGFELVDPGMVWVPEWHPEDVRIGEAVSFPGPNHAVVWAGVGRKRRG